MTVAPKDDLLIIPQDQITKVDQPTAEVGSNHQSPDFSPPSGWGKIPVDSTPKTEIPEYPETEDQDQKEKKESGLVRFVKIFLISVALILLGVLLGVLASSFLGGSSPTINTQAPTPTQSTIVDPDVAPPASQSSQTENQVETDYSKKIEYRNNGAGPYSFDLLITDDWKIATKSTEKNNINIVLNNQDLFVKLFYNPSVSTEVSKVCLLAEEVAPKNIPYLKYSQYKEVMVNELNWRLVRNSQSTASAAYSICEQNTNNQYVSLTSVGFVTTGKNNGNEIDTTEENKILNLFKGLKIMNSTSSSWKKYTNTEKGVSFQYPADAKTTTRDPDPFPVVVQVDNLKPRTGGGGGPEFEGWMIYISETQPNQNNLSLRDWAKEKKLYLSDSGVSEVDSTETVPIDTSIDGLSAIKWEMSGPGAMLSQYLVKRPNGVVLIIVHDNYGRDVEVTDKVISSLKFSK